MNNKDIFRAFGSISDGLIDDSVKPPKGKKLTRILASAGALTACAALALGITRPWEGGAPAGDDTVPPYDSAQAVTPGNGVFVPAPEWDGIYIPPDPMPEAPDPGVAVDMVGFFIYNGRLYTQTGQYAAISLRDGYVCTVTGDIDEWSGADEYVEGASSVAGDVYAVKGYDTSFRLCMDGPDGLIEFYECLSGLALQSGQDLFGDLLRIENYVGAYYVLDADWENDIDARHELDPGSLDVFISLLLVSPMQDWGRDSENGDIFGHGFAEAHLYFTLSDGTTVPLRLFENGCVMYDGSAARVCAYMPGAIFDAVFEACT